MSQPATWWGWAFHLARLAVLAAGVGGADKKHQAAWVAYLDRRAEQCFGFAERGLVFGAAAPELLHPVDDLCCRLARKPLAKLQVFGEGDGWHLIDLVDSGRAVVAVVDGEEVAHLTSAGRARALEFGVMPSHTRGIPGPSDEDVAVRGLDVVVDFGEPDYPPPPVLEDPPSMVPDVPIPPAPPPTTPPARRAKREKAGEKPNLPNGAIQQVPLPTSTSPSPPHPDADLSFLRFDLGRCDAAGPSPSPSPSPSSPSPSPSPPAPAELETLLAIRDLVIENSRLRKLAVGAASSTSSPSSPTTVVYTPGMTMEQVEAATIRAALRSSGSLSAAAKTLGMAKSTIWRRAKALGVDVAEDEDLHAAA